MNLYVLYRNLTFAVAIALCIAVAGCGGSSTPKPQPVNAAPTPPPGAGQVNPPTIVVLAPGQTGSGTDIFVPPPAAMPALNAKFLGVTQTTTGSASDTGSTISRGVPQPQQVLLFGPGLSANVQISISGPLDIPITNPQTISAKDGTPGVVFTVVLTPNTALGARTVILQNAQNDITTFTGGLEVVP